MNEDSVKLLKECNSGCKMAIDSIDQIESHVQDMEMLRLIDDYRQKHEEIEAKTTSMLRDAGKSGEGPGVMASAMAWTMTELKMMKKDDQKQAAKLLMNGCNMGIQSICSLRNGLREASREATEVSDELIRAEEDFMRDIKEFL